MTSMIIIGLSKAGPFYPYNVPVPYDYGLVNYADAAARSNLQFPKVQALPQDFLQVKEPFGGSKAGSESNVCLTESCVITASNLLQQMDRSVDPCKDFYRFTCGGYIDNTVLPEHKTRTGWSY